MLQLVVGDIRNMTVSWPPSHRCGNLLALAGPFLHSPQLGVPQKGAGKLMILVWF
jgi:hypothetical protein